METKEAIRVAFACALDRARELPKGKTRDGSMSRSGKGAAVAMSEAWEFTLYNPAHKLPPFYKGWPAQWRTFLNPIRHVAMIGGTWYSATWQRDARHYKIEEIA